MVKSKVKAIQADLGIFMHIPAYSDKITDIQELFRYIQAYSKPCVTLTCLERWYIWNPGTFRIRSIFRIVVYSKPWHIQNPGVFTTLVYLEPWCIQNRGLFRTLSNIYDDYFQITVSAFQALYFGKKYDLFNRGLIFTPEVFI